jgi:hypothetical protein
MASMSTLPQREVNNSSTSLRWPLLIMTAGFIARLIPAWRLWLNADEALHYLLSVQPSLALTYRASLTTAHPPLLIVFMHYWQRLGTTEFILRLPSVLAGTAACGMAFLCFEKVTDRKTALIGLTLMALSPPLISLSAEIRQYPLLWLFSISALYLLEVAVSDRSWLAMLAASCLLWLAMLTHYSAFLFVMTFGIYSLIRIVGARPKAALIAVWATGQAATAGLALFLLRSHVQRLQSNGLQELIASTYLRASIYHKGEVNFYWFMPRENLRFFHYLFSQGAVGALALALFLAGVVLLAGQHRQVSSASHPSPRLLALLLAFPFFANSVLALADIYPFGGTRHNSYLAVFAILGIAVALAHWQPRGILAQRSAWAAMVLILLLCNVFPTPRGEFIHWKDQQRPLMIAAVTGLRQSLEKDPHAILLTDNQGGLLLSYYLCGEKIVQFEEPFQPFFEARCDGRRALTIDPTRWIFKGPTFAGDLAALQQRYSLQPDTSLYLFQAGWVIDKEKSLRQEMARFGCTEQNFGHNILVCRIGLHPLWKQSLYLNSEDQHP